MTTLRVNLPKFNKLVTKNERLEIILTFHLGANFPRLSSFLAWKFDDIVRKPPLSSSRGWKSNNFERVKGRKEERPHTHSNILHVLGGVLHQKTSSWSCKERKRLMASKVDYKSVDRLRSAKRKEKGRKK